MARYLMIWLPAILHSAYYYSLSCNKNFHGWLDQVGIRITQLSTKLKLKLRLTLAIPSQRRRGQSLTAYNGTLPGNRKWPPRDLENPKMRPRGPKNNRLQCRPLIKRENIHLFSLLFLAVQIFTLTFLQARILENYLSYKTILVGGGGSCTLLVFCVTLHKNGVIQIFLQQPILGKIGTISRNLAKLNSNFNLNYN